MWIMMKVCWDHLIEDRLDSCMSSEKNQSTSALFAKVFDEHIPHSIFNFPDLIWYGAIWEPNHSEMNHRRVSWKIT